MLAGLIVAGARAASGDLDPGFGSGGLVVTNFGSSSDDYATGVAVQADGKIVAAGYRHQGGEGFDIALARYTTSGALDPSFGTGGRVRTDLATDDEARAVALQADGKIVVAGRSNAGGGNDFLVARYTESGALDPSFGTGGIVLTDVGGTDIALAVAIQGDGRIVVAGDTVAVDSSDFALARYTTSGALDPSFGTDGIVITNFTGFGFDEATALALQRDGRIVAAGFSPATPLTYDFALARYTPTGVLDPSFGTGGKVLTDFGGETYDQAYAVKVQRDGRIVAAGLSGANFDFALARYTRSGALDATFGTGGLVLTDFGGAPGEDDDVAYAMAIQQDGKIVAAGFTAANGQDFALARYTDSGALDAGFGAGGLVKTNFTGLSDVVNALALQQDGKIVAAGFAGRPPADFALARYFG